MLMKKNPTKALCLVIWGVFIHIPSEAQERLSQHEDKIKDTLSYLNENFISRKSDFIHQPFSNLLNKLQLPVTRYFSDFQSGGNINYSGTLVISFNHHSYLKGKFNKNENYIEFYVNWETPAAADSAGRLVKKNKGRWTEDERDYYGKLIVKDFNIYAGMESSRLQSPTLDEVWLMASQFNMYKTYQLNYFRSDSLNYALRLYNNNLLDAFLARFHHSSPALLNDYQHALAVFKAKSFNAVKAFKQKLIGYVHKGRIRDPQAQALGYIFNKYNTGIFLMKMEADKKKYISVFDNRPLSL